ncbi:universal stress protein [Phaeacidiphilus oryzae]|jgi:nucleotide-binding universal stress UspA family protein|uniref:universal stress protein n=1 Tax=Phaeacidiphilus oryzae TaxID=348818 RepID=UPI00068C00FD|nr:universal stress protein [Phaeacidiphilus oryzae]
MRTGEPRGSRGEAQGEQAAPGRERVVVGVSGSPASRVALRRAAEEARRLRRPLLVVQAWRPPNGETAARVAPCPELDREIEFRAQARLDRILLDEWVYLTDVQVTSWSLRAPVAAEALVRVARPGDLLVVGGAAGRSLFRGATRRAVRARARCRVLETPRPVPGPSFRLRRLTRGGTGRMGV